MSFDRIVVGLGNPGARYRSTRHNLGFHVVDRIAERLAAGPDVEECGALVRAAPGVLLARPQTFMNRSGMAVRCLADLHGVEPSKILVVLDDIALPLGRLRIRGAGGAGGHRGMESIIESLRSEEVPRLRLGIAPPADPEGVGELADFVLARFSVEELEAVEAMTDRAAEAVACWLAEGVEACMNRFNG